MPSIVAPQRSREVVAVDQQVSARNAGRMPRPRFRRACRSGSTRWCRRFAIEVATSIASNSAGRSPICTRCGRMFTRCGRMCPARFSGVVSKRSSSTARSRFETRDAAPTTPSASRKLAVGHIAALWSPRRTSSAAFQAPGYEAPPSIDLDPSAWIRSTPQHRSRSKRLDTKHPRRRFRSRRLDRIANVTTCAIHSRGSRTKSSVPHIQTVVFVQHL